MESLKIQRNRLESIHRQKSHELWRKEGNQNTKYFHLSTVVKGRRNRLEAIRDGNFWIHGDQNIAEYFKTKFGELYRTQHPKLDEDFESLLVEKVTFEENNFLSRIPSEEEIKGSVWDLHPLKSPGLDVFLVFFSETTRKF